MKMDFLGPFLVILTWTCIYGLIIFFIVLFIKKIKKYFDRKFQEIDNKLLFLNDKIESLMKKDDET